MKKLILTIYENNLDSKVEKLEMKVELLDRYVHNFFSSFLGMLALVMALIIPVIGGAGYYFIRHTIEKVVNDDIEKQVRKVIREEIMIYHESGTTNLNENDEIILEQSIEGIDYLIPKSVLRVKCSPSGLNTWSDVLEPLKAELSIDSKSRRVIKITNNQVPKREVDWTILWLNK